MLITKEKIIQDTKLNRKIVIYSIYTAVGVLITFFPLLLSKNLDLNTLVWSAIFFVAFGIPFGYVIGLHNLLKTIKEKKSAEANNLKIIVDRIINMRTVAGSSKNLDDNYCQFTLEYYTDKTNKNVSVSFDTFRSMHLGDKCTLVFLNNSKKPTIIYSGNEYLIDRSLAGNVIYQAMDSVMADSSNSRDFKV